MMAQSNDAAQAERLSRRRARLLPVLAILLAGQQATYFTQDNAIAGTPSGSGHIAAWLVLSVVVLLVLATGGGWLYSRKVRALANDEGTRVHRDSAFRAGFFASTAACVALYFYSMFQPLSGREAVHFVLTAGVFVTVIWFAFLERRAHSDA